MKVSGLSSPPITDARAQRSAESQMSNKTIYEPDPISSSIMVKTALTPRRGLQFPCKLYPVDWALYDKYVVFESKHRGFYVYIHGFLVLTNLVFWNFE